MIEDIIRLQQMLLAGNTVDEIETAVRWWKDTAIKDLNKRGTVTDPLLIDRRTAHNRGLRHFYTGQPCKWGHVAQRYVQNGSCVACINFAKRPAAAARNTVMPPSPLAFPPDTPREYLNPKLVSKVWGRLLVASRPIIEEELAAAGFVRETWEPRLTQWAKDAGWKSYEHVRQQHATDASAYEAGLLVWPELGGDGAPTHWLKWLQAGGTHAEAVARGWITGWESET